MPPKKVSVTPEVPTQEVKPTSEKLLPVTVFKYFVDGNLAGFFAQYDYPVEWKRNEKRRLPAWVIDRARQSGAEIEFLHD